MKEINSLIKKSHNLELKTIQAQSSHTAKLKIAISTLNRELNKI